MLERIVEIISAAARQLTPVVDENASPKAVKVHADDLVTVCQELHKHPETYFDMLSCITGVDNGPAAATLDIAYNLYSIPYNLHLMLKVTVPRDNGEVDSVTSIWKTANWHERELFDMFGITVRNHPDLRRILLPADWDGNPLRKDYKAQAYYKNIKLDY